MFLAQVRSAAQEELLAALRSMDQLSLNERILHLLTGMIPQ